MIGIALAASIVAVPPVISSDEQADAACVEATIEMGWLFQDEATRGDPAFERLRRSKFKGALGEIRMYFLGRLSVRDPKFNWAPAEARPRGHYHSAIWLESTIAECRKRLPPDV